MILSISAADLRGILPEITLLVTASFLFLVRPSRRATGMFAFVGLATAAFSLVEMWGSEILLFLGAYSVNAAGGYLKYLALIAAGYGVLQVYHDRQVTRHHTEIVALMLLVVTGAFLLVSARHLAVAYIAFELLSVPSYALVGSIRSNSKSTEGGLKYAVFGGAASAFILYGVSLLFGASGSLYYPAIASQITFTAPVTIACVFVFAGVMYKLAAAPFHYWCPDAFEAAPVSVASFLSIAPKIGGFGLLIVLGNLFGNSRTWILLLGAGAVLSMTVGNLAAISQSNVKRLLAYSSVAHAGYILVAAACHSAAGNSSILFYITVYLFMNMGAFYVAQLAAPKAEVSEFNGLVAVTPVLSFFMAVFLFSLTGLPPFGGFIGKLFIISSALQKSAFVLIAFLVANSVISLYYYARILRAMYFEKPDVERKIEHNPVASAALAFATAAIFILGLYWGPIARITGLAAGI